MSVSASCALILGFRVHPEDICKKVKDDVPRCSNGHPRSSPTAKFCEHDGKPFDWVETQAPTETIIKVARRLKWKRVNEVTNWEEKVRDEVGGGSRGEPGFFNVTCVQGGDAPTVLAFGRLIDRASPYDSLYDPIGHDPEFLAEEADKIAQLRDELGFRESPIGLYLTLYYG